MLKRSLIVLATLMLSAQANVALAELKIGVYDARQILNSMPAVEKEEKKLADEFEPKQKEIDSKGKALQALEEDLKKNSVTNN